MSNRLGGSSKVEGKNPDEFVYDPRLVEARLKKWFPELSGDQVLQLVKFQTALTNHNKSLGLVPGTSIRNAEAVHIADCILASRLVFPQLVPGAPLYDLGSGGGLPGLVFAIVQSSITQTAVEVILVEKDPRKVEFCKNLISELSLNNVSVHAGQVEDLPQKLIKNAVARGLAALPRVLLLARKSVQNGGKLFHLKGDAWATELAQVPSQLFSYWSPSLLGQYRIPETNTDMSVVLTDKIAD